MTAPERGDFLVQRIDRDRAATWMTGTVAEVDARMRAEGGRWKVISARPVGAHPYRDQNV